MKGFVSFMYGVAMMVAAFIILTFFTGCATVVPQTPMDGWPDPGWAYPNETDHVIEDQHLYFERLN